jgi:iron(III) transport system ATP-binding protein
VAPKGGGRPDRRGGVLYSRVMVRRSHRMADVGSSIDLRVSDLHKSFGAHAVLTGIELNVPVGSLTAVLGPSGSGKTTLLRIVAGFERADRGAVALGGRVVEDERHALPPEQRGIGYVPQEGSLFPHVTVAANVAFGIPRSARRRLAANTDALLEMVGLGGLGHRYPHQLSGGQQQRVALARALAIEPTLVLMDEPFSSLDAGLRASVRSDVQGVLRAHGITAVLVTHDQDEALSMADQVAVIRGGVIGQCGTPQELYDHPVDPSMAQFLGDANLVPATVEGDSVTTAFGRLALRAESDVAARPGPVLALVRPEQLVISTAATGLGQRARVDRSEFHGHDAVTGRADGNLVIAPGSEVEITAVGTSLVWPVGAGGPGGPARDGSP